MITPTKPTLPTRKPSINLEQLIAQITEVDRAYICATTDLHCHAISEMISMVHATRALTLEINAEFPGALKPTLQRLRNIEQTGEWAAARATILERLPIAFEAYMAALETSLAGTFPEWRDHPDDNPEKNPRQLPVWTDEEHGPSVEAFAMLCLGLWACNTNLGYHPASIGTNGELPDAWLEVPATEPPPEFDRIYLEYWGSNPRETTVAGGIKTQEDAFQEAKALEARGLHYAITYFVGNRKFVIRSSLPRFGAMRIPPSTKKAQATR